ncbi:MAG TPA: carboxypeptidase-like regulatory domain-containing protein [Terracidiphilus sp.]|nr:carboxypeptidase-like regulatory domain-containing protein [Terracidiphilus sp.]
MAVEARSRMGPLAAVALLAGAATLLCAQAPSHGSLAGKLTDLQSSPLGGATVILRNQATGAEVRATTARNGAYRFTDLAPGEYTLKAESPQLGEGSLEDIEVDAGAEARVQAAMQFEPVPAEPAEMLAAQPVPAVPVEAGVKAGIAPPHAISLPVEPPRQIDLANRAAPAAAAQAPLPVQRAELDAMVPSEPLRLAPGTALTAPDLTSGAPAAAAIAAVPENTPDASEVARSTPPASIAAATLTPLALIHQASIVGEGLAASELAAAGVRAAFEFRQASTPPIETARLETTPASEAVTTTIPATELQSLPVSGRDWQGFLEDSPTASTAAGGASQPSLRGAVSEPAAMAIDGASLQLAFDGGSAGAGRSAAKDPTGDAPDSMGQAWAGGRGAGVSEAAIYEVQTVAGNVEAEDSRAAGGRVNIETQHGTSVFHGQAFLFDRQNNWGAQNPYTQWVKNTGTSAAPVFTSQPFTPPDHETIWGIGAGSRIRRDKLFWFGALDSYHRNDPGLSITRDPTANSSVFFYLPQVNDPQIQLLGAQLGESDNQAYNDYIGVPAAGSAPAGLEQLDSLLGPAPRRAAQWVGFARVDWQAAERHHFVFEGIGADWNAPGGGLTRLSETYGAHSFGSSEASETWLLARWEAFLTPNLLATTQGSAGRDVLSAKPDKPSAFEQTLLGGSASGQLPQMVVDSSYGFTIGNPSRFGPGSYPDEHLYLLQQHLDWVHNSLLLKSGFELGHNADSTSLLRNGAGTYTYSRIENFIADALAFERFGLTNLLNPQNPHNCDVSGKPWYASNGQLMGLGALPCYSHYSQTIGPADWHLSTNDWAGYTTAQWQPNKLTVLSAGLRWEREQLPPPIARLNNPNLPLTEKLPSLGDEWSPRISLAVGAPETRWPILRLGYGMYYGRTRNDTLERALTQTGSFNGDLNYFIRPSDGFTSNDGTSSAPPFPYVLTGPPGSVVTPGAVEFAPSFRNPEVHQAVAAVEESLPGRVELTASALLSLGRRLPVYLDANLTPPTATQTITYDVCDQTPNQTLALTPSTTGACGAPSLGPIRAAQITVPLYANWPSALCTSGALLNPAGQCGWLNPSYQQVEEIVGKANSTYEAAMLKLVRYGRRGLTFHAHYTYAHAMDWNPGQFPLDPADFNLEYGTSNLDVRHSAAAMLVYEAPWKLRAPAGRLANGWMLSGIGQFQSGLPYTMRVSGSLPEEFTSSGALIEGLAPGMNGSGGAERVYGLGSDGAFYNVGRNTFRYPETWKADLRLGKSFNFGHMREMEILAESFNLFNHQNVTEIETTGYTIGSGSATSRPTLNFLTGARINTTTNLPSSAFGQPLSINGSNFYRERQIELGVRMKF